MAALNELLPPAKSTTASYYDHSKDAWFKQRYSGGRGGESEGGKWAPNPVPPYLERAGFVPRKPEDFGDGGAFPEIHIAQYPLEMGRDRNSKPGGNVLPLTTDSNGDVSYDTVVRQNENSSRIVYSSHRDLVPKLLREEEAAEEEEDLQKEIDETTRRTKDALEKIVNVRLSAAQPKNVPAQSSGSRFIKYKPSQQAAAFNSGAKERIIRMVEMPTDPLEPPKFKHKRVPKATGSPPVPVMHSPPRPVTVRDQQDWKIPPCISNWKNPKGYTIPLDKRLAADGRGLQEVQINDNFAKLSEALYVAEQKAREAVAMRSKVQKEMAMKEKERKEVELRALAHRARAERTGGRAEPMGEGVEERETIRDERRRERDRERRLEAKDVALGKKSKTTRDRDRDVGERLALGMAGATAGAGSGEVMYDQRLFNQEKGMGSGFGRDEEYTVYDKGLFTATATLSTLYKPSRRGEGEEGDGEMEKILKTDRFRADRGFAGAAERGGPAREGPVEFEEEAAEEEADPFGLDRFLTEVKKGKKGAADRVPGGGGIMRASAGSSMRDSGQAASGRTRIGFERGR